MGLAPCSIRPLPTLYICPLPRSSMVPSVLLLCRPYFLPSAMAYTVLAPIDPALDRFVLGAVVPWLLGQLVSVMAELCMLPLYLPLVSASESAELEPVPHTVSEAGFLA